MDTRNTKKKKEKVEGVYCYAVKSWIIGGNSRVDWMCCPHRDHYVLCNKRVDIKCAIKNWPQIIHPECFGWFGSPRAPPELLCDNCLLFIECIKVAIQ